MRKAAELASTPTPEGKPKVMCVLWLQQQYLIYMLETVHQPQGVYAMNARKVLVFVLTVVCLLGMVAPSFAQEQPAVASINTAFLNVRSGPGLEYGSIITLPFGFGVNMIARNREANWILIELTDGTRGWVNVNYIFTQYPTGRLPITDQPNSTPIVPTGRVNAFTANVYQGPSLQNPVVGTVSLDETVDLLGRNYNATLAQIRLSNGTVGWIESQFIIGSVPVRALQRTDGSVFVPYAPDFPNQSPSSPSQPSTGARYHTILPGETLSTIAQRYGVTIQALAAANGIYNVDRIYYGQQLVIPG
jgi:uncharacterized protein YraI